MALNFNMSCSLYRAFDSDGSLLYVGISHQPKCRMKEHKRKSKWYPLAARIEMEDYKNRFDAMSAERENIARHKPPYNLQLNPKFIRDGYKFVEVV